MNRILLPMLVLSLLVATVRWGWAAEPTAEQEKAIIEIKKLHGELSYDTKSREQTVIGVILKYSQVTDAGLERIKVLRQLQTLDLGDCKQVTDAGLVHLQGLAQLQTLVLRGNRVTDAGLEHLKGLTQLQTLLLPSTAHTDAGLEHLKGLTQLQQLDLMGARVTDVGLEHVKGLTRLQTLQLSGTQVTDAGLAQLKGLTRLAGLCLYYNDKITDAGVKELKKSLPNVNVTVVVTANVKAPVAVQARATPGALPVPLAARLPAFLTAERKQRNLLKDASFENAAGSDWSASTWRRNPQAVTRVDGGREGQHALRLQATVADDVQYRQRVAVKPQTPYLLSGWIKTQDVQIVEKGGTRGANLAVDGAGTWEATAPVLGDTDWTYVTLAFDSGQRTEIGVAARLGFFYSTVTGTAWYDDLCLIEIEDLKNAGENSDADRAADRREEQAVRGVKFLGMTLVDPTKELIRQYGLPDQYPGPIIVEQMKDSPHWGPFGPPPGPGCAFWLVQNPAHGFFFNEDRSPSYTPQTVRELAKAILACTASPEEYEKIWDDMRRRSREQAEKVTGNPEQRARLLKTAEAAMPKEDAGKYICRVVYHYPHRSGTMTTYIRMDKEDLDRLRGIQQDRSKVSERNDKGQDVATDLDAFRRLQQEGLKNKDE